MADESEIDEAVDRLQEGDFDDPNSIYEDYEDYEDYEETAGDDEMKSIGYFTGCPEAMALAERFGDLTMDGLPAHSQALLVAILGTRIYHNLTGLQASVVSERYTNEDDQEVDTELEEALEILGDELTVPQMAGIISFFCQGSH